MIQKLSLQFFNFNTLCLTHILAMIKNKNRLRRIWLRTRHQLVKTQLNRANREVKFALDNHRVNTYKKHISELQAKDSKLWQATRRILKQPPQICSVKINDQVYSSDQEKCDIFSEYLEKTFSTLIPRCNEAFANQIVHDINKNYPKSPGTIDPTSPTEIKALINALPTKKSPGHDLINHIILKNFPSKIITYLAILFNAILRLEYFPNTWKHAHVLLFPKPGKNHKDPNIIIVQLVYFRQCLNY